MPEAGAAKAVTGARAIDLEGRALECLPPGDAADGHAELVSADLSRCEAFDRDARDARGRIARQDTKSAQPRSAQSGGPKRAFDVANPDLTAPPGFILTRIVMLHGLIRIVDSTGPYLRRQLGSAAAPR